MIQEAVDGQEADGVTDSIQSFLGAVLLRGLTPPFDKNEFRVHNIVIVGLATRLPIRASDHVAEIWHKSASRECHTEQCQPQGHG